MIYNSVPLQAQVIIGRRRRSRNEQQWTTQYRRFHGYERITW